MNRQTILLLALAAVLVVALWWLFLFTPGQEDLAAVEDEIVAAEAEQASLRQRIASLEGVRERAPETEAAISRLESLVPLNPALPGAFRQIEAAAEDAGAVVRALAATRPVPVEEGSVLHEIQFTLDVEGSYFQLVDFVRRIEDPTITSRGVDFTTMSISPLEHPTLLATLTGDMYAALDPVPVPPEAVEGTAETATNDAPATDQPTEAATEGES